MEPGALRQRLKLPLEIKIGFIVKEEAPGAGDDNSERCPGAPSADRGESMIAELSRTLPRLASFNPYRTDDLDAAREHIAGLFVPHTLDVVGSK